MLTAFLLYLALSSFIYWRLFRIRTTVQWVMDWKTRIEIESFQIGFALLFIPVMAWVLVVRQLDGSASGELPQNPG